MLALGPTPWRKRSERPRSKSQMMAAFSHLNRSYRPNRVVNATVTGRVAEDAEPKLGLGDLYRPYPGKKGT